MARSAKTFSASVGHVEPVSTSPATGREYALNVHGNIDMKSIQNVINEMAEIGKPSIPPMRIKIFRLLGCVWLRPHDKASGAEWKFINYIPAPLDHTKEGLAEWTK